MAIIFDATAVATFADLAGGFYQRVFEFSSGPGLDNIWLGQVGTNTTIAFGVVGQDGIERRVEVANAIVQGEEATWRTTIEDDGTFTVFKDGVEIGSIDGGLAAVPADVVRTETYIGNSSYAADTPLVGGVSGLTVDTTLINFDDGNYNGTGSNTGTGADELWDVSALSKGAAISGGGGADTIMGGAGNDSLDGGDGDDVITGDDPDAGANAVAGGKYVLGYRVGENISAPTSGDFSGGNASGIVTGEPISIQFVDADDVLSGDNVVNESADDATQLVEINGELFETFVDLTTVYNGSDGEVYTFAIIDVDLNNNGHGLDGPEEDGHILVPLGAVPAAGVTLTAAGSQNTSGISYNSFVTSFNDSIDGGAGNDSIDGGAGNDSIDGGIGDDSIDGGIGDDTFNYDPGDGSDTITDFNTGNTGSLNDGDNTNNDFIDLSGYYDHISELYADQADDGVLNQSNDGTGGSDYSNNTQFGSNNGLTFSGASADSSFFTQDNTGVVCFTEGTLIKTLRGEIPVESLRCGDMVQTKDNGLKPILWIGSRRLGKQDLDANEKLKPVLISPKLIGGDRSLIVSPQHGVLLRHDGEEKLVRATHLAKMKGGGARIQHGRRNVTYYHLLLETHQIVFSNGVPSESFYPGEQAVKALPSDHLDEVRALFPEITRVSVELAYAKTSRAFIPFRQLHSRQLAECH